jgi:hypothetical protein
VKFIWHLAASLSLAWHAAPALGQDGTPPAQQAAAEPARNGALTIPALTPVSIAILIPLGSKISTSGDHFPISLAAPIVIDGHEAIPAGAMGMGEVVHAKKAGGSGAPGELVLAARYLEIGDRRLRLRSLRFGVTGRSAAGEVSGINIAGAAAGVPIGLVGFLIKGGEAVVPEGTVAEAKTAEAFVAERVPTGEAQPALPGPDAPSPGSAEPGRTDAQNEQYAETQRTNNNDDDEAEE